MLFRSPRGGAQPPGRGWGSAAGRPRGLSGRSCWKLGSRRRVCPAKARRWECKRVECDRTCQIHRPRGPCRGRNGGSRGWEGPAGPPRPQRGPKALQDPKASAGPQGPAGPQGLSGTPSHHEPTNCSCQECVPPLKSHFHTHGNESIWVAQGGLPVAARPGVATSRLPGVTSGALLVKDQRHPG